MTCKNYMKLKLVSIDKVLLEHGHLLCRLWLLLCHDHGIEVVADSLACEPKHLLAGPLQFAEP